MDTKMDSRRKRDGYQQFPNLHYRNVLQERIEVPALVRLLDLPARSPDARDRLRAGRGLPALAAMRTESTGRTRHRSGGDRQADQHLQKRAVAAELRRGDVRQMPFADGSFDLVIDFGTCYHVDRPEAALCEIARLLADGGELVHETPLSQLLAHPARAGGRRLPWAAAPELVPCRSAALWSRRVKRRPGGVCADPMRVARGGRS